MQKQEPAAPTGWIAKFRQELTPAKIITAVVLFPILGAIVTGTAASWIDWSVAHAKTAFDDLGCKGRAAMAEGDRLSDLASKEPARALDYLKAANPHYEKAYGCGFPDAGIRLAVAHCMGLGVPKDALKARQYILEIEGKYDAKRGRAADARKACGF